MFVVYLVAAILGWPLVLFFVLFAGDDGGAEVDADLDVDADIGGDGAASLAGDLLSVRSMAFFLAFFGLTGLVLGWLDVNAVIVLVAAMALGGSIGINSWQRLASTVLVGLSSRLKASGKAAQVCINRILARFLAKSLPSCRPQSKTENTHSKANVNEYVVFHLRRCRDAP